MRIPFLEQRRGIERKSKALIDGTFLKMSMSADNVNSFVSKLFDISVNVPRISTYYLTAMTRSRRFSNECLHYSKEIIVLCE